VPGEPPWIHYESIKKVIPPLAQLIERAVDEERGVEWIIEQTGTAKDPRSRLFYYLYGYVQSGQQVQVLGPKMQGLLARTSLDRVPREALVFPHEHYFIALPGCKHRLWDPKKSDAGVWQEVRGVYVWQDSDNEVFFKIEAPAGRMDNEFLMTRSNDAHVDLDLDESVSWPGGGIEGWVEAKVMEAMETHGYFRHPRWATHFAEVAETHRQVMRLVINSVLYTNAAGADLGAHPYMVAVAQRRRMLQQERQKLRDQGGRPERRHGPKVEAKLSRLTEATIVWLGGDVEQGSGRASPGPRRPGERAWTRGHWKLPARKHGPRQLLWVQPYERYKDQPRRLTGRRYQHEEDRDDD
jgi:hypothetical protein